MYQNRGILFKTSEASACTSHGWSFATLHSEISFIPLEGEFVFLVDGEDTKPKESELQNMTETLRETIMSFSESAYIEAAYWAGQGMQASVVQKKGSIFHGPVIADDAINIALRFMGVIEGRRISGIPVEDGGDPFDIVGLGQHRSVEDWLEMIVKPNADDQLPDCSNSESE